MQSDHHPAATGPLSYCKVIIVLLQRDDQALGKQTISPKRVRSWLTEKRLLIYIYFISMAFYDFKKKPALTTKEGEKETLYPSIVYNGTISTKELLERAAQQSGFKVGDMEGTLMTLFKVASYYIGEGYRVELGEFGYFSGRIKSRMVANKKEIRATSIRFNGVNFLASKEFRQRSAGDLERTPNRTFKSSSQLSEAELERRLMTYIEKNGFITRSTYTRLTGRLKNKALEDLRGFVSKGVIEEKGMGNQMHFVQAKETKKESL